MVWPNYKVGRLENFHRFNNYEGWITFVHVNHSIPLYFEIKFGKKEKKRLLLNFPTTHLVWTGKLESPNAFSLSGAQGFDTSDLKQSVEPSKSLERRYNRPVHALAEATSLSLFKGLTAPLNWATFGSNALSNSLCRMSLMQHDTSVLLLARVTLL
jgi:hypothetical protein